MHYYKKNIGDYAKKCGRLTMLQHGAYTLLLDTCYDRERFPTLDDAIEWTWASTPEEVQAVEFVLRRFFVLNDGIYVQMRIQEEITAYHGNAERNTRIALEREAKRRENSTKRARSVHEAPRSEHEAPPNQEPLTINQEPLTNIKNKEKKAAIASLNFYDADELVIADFVKQRKTKATQTAIDGIKREAAKAGFTMTKALQTACERGWQSFKSDWVSDKSGGYKTANEKVQDWANEGRDQRDNDNNIIDIN